jgi:hypothetical protein
MAAALTSICINDNDEVEMRAFWHAGGDFPPFVIVNVDSISLYVEPAQLDRLIALLAEVREKRANNSAQAAVDEVYAAAHDCAANARRPGT